MSNRPSKYLWFLLGIAAVVGIADAFLPRGGGAYGALTFPLWVSTAILLFKWCKAHAHASGITEPSGSAALCGLLAPVGVPLYFFRGFGFKKGMAGSAKAIGFYILFSLAYGAANIVEYVAHNNSLVPTPGTTHHVS